MAKKHVNSIDMEGCIEITRLLLGVAKCKEYNASQHINSMCHECIRTTHLLFGIAKYEKDTNQHKKKKSQERQVTWVH